jgi:hypothetical protein
MADGLGSKLAIAAAQARRTVSRNQVIHNSGVALAAGLRCTEPSHIFGCRAGR